MKGAECQLLWQDGPAQLCPPPPRETGDRQPQPFLGSSPRLLHQRSYFCNLKQNPKFIEAFLLSLHPGTHVSTHTHTHSANVSFCWWHTKKPRRLMLLWRHFVTTHCDANKPERNLSSSDSQWMKWMEEEKCRAQPGARSLCWDEWDSVEWRCSSAILFGCAGMKSILTKSKGGEAHCRKMGLAAGWHGNGVLLASSEKERTRLILYSEGRWQKIQVFICLICTIPVLNIGSINSWQAYKLCD